MPHSLFWWGTLAVNSAREISLDCMIGSVDKLHTKFPMVREMFETFSPALLKATPLKVMIGEISRYLLQGTCWNTIVDNTFCIVCRHIGECWGLSALASAQTHRKSVSFTGFMNLWEPNTVALYLIPAASSLAFRKMVSSLNQCSFHILISNSCCICTTFCF